MQYWHRSDFCGIMASHQQKGKGMFIKYKVGDCILGKILVAQSAKGICCILFGNKSSSPVSELHKLFPFAKISEKESISDNDFEKVVKFVEMNQEDLQIPLDMKGTDFQLKVWNFLLTIPPGQILSYSEVAELIGMRKAVRSVASACSANKLAVVIPCHRVVHSNRGLSKYKWGVWRKNWLLSKEKKMDFSEPTK